MNNAEAIRVQVKGFLIPEFSQRLPDGRTLNGLTEQGFRMVLDGYACGECLAYFSTYTIRCPVCGTTRDVGLDVQEAPQLWVDHLEERYSPEPYEKPPVLNPFQAIDLVSKNPDVEHIQIRKLRKKGRGRS